jgi:hypothetical protein
MHIDVLVVKLQYDYRFNNLRDHNTSPLLYQLPLISALGALYNFKEKKEQTKKSETQGILGKAVSLPGQ